MRTFLPWMLAASLLAAPAAQACSVVSGYAVPTTLGLAVSADTIVVATVEDETDGGQISVKPTLLLKGPALPERLTMHGYLETSEFKATRSSPRELRRPNPDTLSGACTRYIFAKGMKLLLFFEREKGQLQFAGYPFARVSEDVPSEDALWVKAVRLYVDIARLPEGERRAAMIARRDALRAEGGAEAITLADDLDLELAAGHEPIRD